MSFFKKSFKLALIALFAFASLFSALGCSVFNKKPSEDILPHLISESDADSSPVRPVNALGETKGFTANSVNAQFDELNEILYEGYRPDFSKDVFPEIEKTYNAAIQVLNRYIKNDFSAFERLHAIHDYIAYYTEYDFDLLENASSAKESNPSFRPDGVFLERKAVCDGFSKAFLLLCGIEQIRCIRITGQYSSDGNTVNHAWNKVLLDGEWYNVDSTMDSWHVYTDSKHRVDILNHGYFLVSDEAMFDPLTGHHTESGLDAVNYECPNSYDFYSEMPLGIGSHKMKLTSLDELLDVFSKIKDGKRKIGKVELKLDFPEYDKSNLSRPDAYASYIAEAYKKVPDADFAFKPESGMYPYQRYPDGVFVFLIYA